MRIIAALAGGGRNYVSQLAREIGISPKVYSVRGFCRGRQLDRCR